MSGGSFRINPITGQSEYQMNEPKKMSDPYAAGYRPAVHVDLRQIRQCPDRDKAIKEYEKASSWEETDAYPKPEPRGIDWSLASFILAMACLGLCLAFAVALVMS